VAQPSPVLPHPHPDYFKDHFVSLPTTLYRSGELCGACVRMWCVDSVCTDALVRNASFMVRWGPR